MHIKAYNLVDWPMLWYNATERIIVNVPGERDVKASNEDQYKLQSAAKNIY